MIYRVSHLNFSEQSLMHLTGTMHECSFFNIFLIIDLQNCLEDLKSTHRQYILLHLIFTPIKRKFRINVTLFLCGPPYIYHGIQ